MRKRQNTLAYALFFLLCCVAIATANGQEPTVKQIRQASEPSAISDWALSGIVWSDASLTEKLARQAAAEDTPEETLAELSKIAEQAQKTVEVMERFGWTQLRRGGAASAGGQSTRPRPKPPLKKLIPSQARPDTETPVGVDDPGIDDELRGKDTDLDIDQYRVDDVVDETPRERRNLADAVEDGIEKAIASSPSRGIDGENPAHISKREVQTRSATMPYKPDSIYDNDDFDPDTDYLVNNPLGRFADNPDSVNYTEEDDDIDRGDPDASPDGEDELAFQLEGVPPKSPQSREAARKPPMRRSTDFRNFTRQQSPAIQDARWVQFHLDANQLYWNQIGEGGPSVQDVRHAYRRMKVHARLAIENSSEDRLEEALQTLLGES